MAEQGANIDFVAHERAYGRFLNMFKYGAIACFVIAFVVVLIISR